MDEITPIDPPEGPGDLLRAVVELTAAARTVDRHVRHRSWLFAALLVVIVLGLAARTEVQQRRIGANAARIEVLFWEQCTLGRSAAVRQNALIDSAVQAEKRKPHPDAKRLRDLNQFRPAVADCGTRPR
jgi:hypothetical protein